MRLLKIFLTVLFWSKIATGQTTLSQLNASNTSPNQFESIKQEAPTNPGPVVAVIQKLVFNTVQVADEMQLQLNTKMQRTSNALLGSIQVLVANAMDDLSGPLFEASEMLKNDTCPQTWKLDDVYERIDKELKLCTDSMQSDLTSFRDDAAYFTNEMQSYVDGIVNLPQRCEIMNFNENHSSVESYRCFVQKMTEYNNAISTILNKANDNLIQSRQRSRSYSASAKTCVDKVVQETTAFFDQSFAKCRST